MDFNQVGFGVQLLLLAVGLSAAQWPGLINVPAGLQPNKPSHSSLQVSAGLPSQWTQSGPQSGSPAVAPLGLHFQNPSDAQDQQVMQRPVKKLTWRYPAAPQIPTPPAPVNFMRQSNAVPTQSVTARCNETAVYVEVRKDLFGTSAPHNIAALTLGGCAAKGVDVSSQVLVYESPLHGCNSKLTVTANELVYIFTLGIASAPISSAPILRSPGALAFVECHYRRFHNVSSSALLPAWIPYASAQAAEERLLFFLRLMTDDWIFQRPSDYVFQLGELINIEASVVQFSHVPLRVFVDSCVATAVPDVNAVPRYSFIENHGCLIDAKLAHSSSRFMPQTQAAKLGFQLEAFKFQHVNSNWFYIACILKATAASAPADAEHKACSFSGNRWTAAYGADQVCSCCSSSCGLRKGRDLSSEQGLQLEKEVSLGPIMVLENVLV
ncbi:zona pellucida sperm-binding protein 3 isoform X2 [Ictalurus punctatus]|uniref:Zona pellucida sperm-binding protein 3 n=1 Tax=Ictalurus punctatus TaxID=7998 RepID=A0A2D0Q7S3_ICTPU|nr:zona pellucida sperm-binding protein 3 isoform X2 [Ictalurus punctatus]